MTLTEFLLARLADDEQVAHIAQRADCPAGDVNQLWTVTERDVPCEHGASVALGPRGSVEASPARVLAECEAKRRIVERTLEGCSHPPRVGGWCLEYCDATLRDLALPYADHPDYRDEWKP